MESCFRLFRSSTTLCRSILVHPVHPPWHRVTLSLRAKQSRQIQHTENKPDVLGGPGRFPEPRAGRTLTRLYPDVRFLLGDQLSTQAREDRNQNRLEELFRSSTQVFLLILDFHLHTHTRSDERARMT